MTTNERAAFSCSIFAELSCPALHICFPVSCKLPLQTNFPNNLMNAMLRRLGGMVGAQCDTWSQEGVGGLV